MAVAEDVNANSLRLAKLESENKKLREELEQLRAYKLKYGVSLEQIQDDCEVRIKILETEQRIELQKVRDQADKLSQDNKDLSDSNEALKKQVSGLRKELADMTTEKRNLEFDFEQSEKYREYVDLQSQCA